jgi:FkbM family methyltransferase
MLHRLTDLLLVIALLNMAAGVFYFWPSSPLTSVPLVYAPAVLPAPMNVARPPDPLAALAWDRRLPLLPAAGGVPECRWFTTRPVAAERPFRMCLRAHRDLLSDTVANNGRWGDCDSLLALWQQSLARHPPPPDVVPVFVDVGANIGACTLLMLRAGYRVVAFEPLSSNLFYLTQSLLALGADAVRNATLYPVACGRAAATHDIYVEPGNAGNAVIDQTTFTSKAVAERVRVIRCDRVLWPADGDNDKDDAIASLPPPHIALLKLDAQGYEMHVLAGLARVLGAHAIKAVKTEIATAWLRAQGTSPSAFLAALADAGFEMTHDGHARITTAQALRYDAQPRLITDAQGLMRAPA